MIVEQGRSGTSPSSPVSDYSQFFERLIHAPQRLLLLDYDGTLAPFHVDPEAAAPYAGVREQLDDIMNDPRSHVIVVSGRPARELLPLLRLRRAPEIWGSDGWEHLAADGSYGNGPLDPSALRRFMRDNDWITQIRGHGGRCEVKPNGITIHWRGCSADQIADILTTVVDGWKTQRLHERLLWREFDGGIGLRVPGRDKSHAVHAALHKFPDAGAAYLGDDLADEDAFAAINGRGLSVLVRAEWRVTVAQTWLRPPEQLLDFLGRWRAAACAAAN